MDRVVGSDFDFGSGQITETVVELGRRDGGSRTAHQNKQIHIITVKKKKMSSDCRRSAHAHTLLRSGQAADSTGKRHADLIHTSSRALWNTR